jgi:hypothetical protein
MTVRHYIGKGYAERKLNDGRQLRIVKMFYEPAKLEGRLQQLNWYGTGRFTIAQHASGSTPPPPRD